MKIFSKQSLKQHLLCLGVILCLPSIGGAQVNSGSNGSDGAFNPTTNTVINMADHPDGIYQFTSVNIPGGVVVTFIPNVNNTPVVWLVQGSNIINGVVDVSAKDIDFSNPGAGRIGGPGGFRGGSAAGGAIPGDGLGPGGGKAPSVALSGWSGGGNASHATLGAVQNGSGNPGELYGNSYLLPLVGGSGGGGGFNNYGGLYGGLGGGGAILIASSTEIVVNGTINAKGGGNYSNVGNGSGGSVRLIATTIRGSGTIDASASSLAGQGRVRFDSFENNFVGTTQGVVTRGYQPIIIPPPNQAVSLSIQSVAGIAVPQNPTGASFTPDVIVPGQQANPIAIVVRCVNIPLNTDVIVDVKPANGPTVRAVGVNNAGTQASSTATVSITMPRGAGTIQAKAVSGIADSLGASLNNGEKFRHYAQTGLTAGGEVFAKMEITATLGKRQEIAYITESGKRFVLPRN